MLKPLKIVMMLAITVIGLSLAVFAVERITSEVIAERKAEEMKEIIDSLSDIFPAMESSYLVETAEPTAASLEAGITTTLLITDADGNAKGYVYFVTFRGYASDIEYMISVDNEGVIGGFEMLSQAESAASADEFMEPAYWDQFTNLSIQLAGSGDFDGVTGASFTTNYLKISMETLYNYHLDTYGFTPLTPEQVVQQKLEALAGGTMVEYTNTNPFAAYGITEVLITEDDSVVVYKAEFVGFNGDDVNQYAIAYDTTTNNVLGYITLYSGDTAEYGAEKMYDETLWSQFDGTASTDMTDVTVDTFSGASVTGLAFESSLQKVALYHRWEFEGEKELTYEERLNKAFDELFTDATDYIDVTVSKGSNPLIETIYDVYDGATYLGVVYHVVTIGASYDDITYIEFMVGIDAAGNYTGLQFLDSTDTKERIVGYYEDSYDDVLIGDAITDPLELVSVAGATQTFNQVRDAVALIVTYHETVYPIMPDPIEADNADLLAAYPSAVSFETVYAEYSYNMNILNIYAAKDVGDAVIGYVYYVRSAGRNAEITYTLGIDDTGLTQQLHIVSDSESWDGAAYVDYNGTYGEDFTVSTWLDLFEGIQYDTINTTNFLAVSGVSETTTPMIDSLSAVAAYHENESVGGAN